MSGRTGRLVFLVTIAVLTALKVDFAARMSLYPDESFYWQCSERPDVHYADLPFMTAALVRAGTAIAGQETLGVRLVFLSLGTLLPFLMIGTARPLVGSGAAWLVGLATLALPGTALLGAVAVPDVPLVFLALLAFRGIESATRSDSLRGWLLASACLALGLQTHYRFVLVPASIALYAWLTPGGRARLNPLRRPRAWLLVAGTAIGLIPAAVHALRRGLEPIGHYLLGRHGIGFDPTELLRHLGGQALLVSPFLYLALLGVLAVLFRRALRGDDRAALSASFALLPLAAYFLASPFHDVALATLHWPLTGYLPLLFFLPVCLAEWLSPFSAASRRTATWLVLALGPVVSGALLVGGARGAPFADPVLYEFNGWPEVADAVRREIETFEENGASRPVVVADNHKVGASLEFELDGAAEVFVLDHETNHRYGRASAYEDWGRGESALRRCSGRAAVVVIQWDESPIRTRRTWVTRVQSFFSSLEPRAEVRAGRGRRKAFFVYRGVVK
jgi:4-amino-4-deoxy-L-arabinose transferase-like glycosyltransferase